MEALPFSSENRGRAARRERFLLLLAPLFFAGCNLAPDYAPPPVETPLKYKEDRSWVEARPRDTLPRGPWWRALGDHSLDELVPMVDAANPDLAVAVASLDQARAYSAKAASALLPHVDLNNSYTANKQSQHRPTRKANTPFSAAGYLNQLLDDRPLNEPDHYGNNLLTLQSSYEIDLWGRVRNAVALGVANSESAAAELEFGEAESASRARANVYRPTQSRQREEASRRHCARLYARAGADENARGWEYRIASRPIQSAGAAGIHAGEAHGRERAPSAARTCDCFAHRETSFLLRDRAGVDRDFLAERFPPGAPLDLLERRPDIAAAERQVAAANAAIGVAKAAFFPRLVVNLSGGTQDTGLSLFNFRNSIWTLGPSITLPIFDAGARSADLAYADALYLKTAAHYRATVLKAYQEVEDALSSMHWLGKEQRSVEIAASAAENVLKISLTLYRDGATNYLDVVTAQTAALEAERTAITLKTRRLEANVALIVALGGGFAAEAPAAEAPTLTAAAAQGPSK